LSREQWRNPALRRLLWQGHWVVLLIVVPTVAFFYSFLGPSLHRVAFGLLFSLTGGLAMGIAVMFIVGFAAGVVISIVGGIGWGLIFGIGLRVGVSPTLGAVASLVVSVSAGTAASAVMGTLSIASTQSLLRQLGGSLYGMILGIGGIVITLGLASIAVSGLLAAVSFEWLAAIFGGAAGGVVGGVAFRLRTRQWRLGLALGLVVGALFGAMASAAGPSGTIAALIITGLGLGGLFALPYLLAERIGGASAGAVGGALGGGGGVIAFIIAADRVNWSLYLFGLLGILPGLTQNLWRPALLYPWLAAWNLLLFRLDERRGSGRPSRLRRHSAFWDERQRLPWPGLDEHVVLVAERHPAEGRAAMEYLFNSGQRWAAQAAQIELDARQLARCATTEAIQVAHRTLGAGELSGPASALLRSFSRISQDVAAALKQESAYNQRLALSAVEDRLDGLLRELTRSNEKYAVRFRPIASQWRQIMADHIRALAEAVEARQEIDSPYVIGVPLTEQQEIFVGRTDISARIEQLLLDRRRPPLLLYGQRRMGKTSLLNNLGRMLPSTITPLFVDLQGPAARATEHGGFLYNLARGMVDSASRQRGLILPALTREALAGDPFTHFDEWLDEVEKALGDNTALLSLDEFEVLEGAFGEGRFSERDVLGMLRHLIQHRPRFKVLLAGSHTLDEVQRWASYLINVQVVQIGYLNEGEALQLIENPVKDFALRYEPEASRRVLALTRGHPFLTQLLCAEIVALKNEQDPAVRRLARLADVEAAVPAALNSGSFFFADIERNQVDERGLAVGRFIAAQGEGAVARREALAQFANPERALTPLLRRDVLEAADGGYRFQVELIRRWFARGG